MTEQSTFSLVNHTPLIAILRGIMPERILPVSEILIAAGFTMIEVPLNSPNALQSIRHLVAEFGQRMAVGAGTVTDPEKAKQVVDTGANLIVTPNCNTQVIEIARQADCTAIIGIMTPTEAFSALQAGATGLKLFPAPLIGLAGYKALREVLPKQTICFAVGGIQASHDSMAPWYQAGISGYGLGTGLFKPAYSLQEIKMNAERYVAIWREMQLSSQR